MRRIHGRDDTFDFRISLDTWDAKDGQSWV
jgi:hypothetical protein